MLIGNARVSTEEQNLAMQLDALRAAGCLKVFADTGVSGAVVERRELNRALRALTAGDVLVVWRLDRLGRSLPHLIEIMTWLGEEGIGFRSLTEAIDTTTASGKLLFHIMAAIAEFERSLIAERTRAGMAAAKARGQHVGRARKISEEEVEWARRTLELGRMTPPEVAGMLRVSRLTLSRSLRRKDQTLDQVTHGP
jgi:DNA invertase Pin-like site-specific DNA recombinase